MEGVAKALSKPLYESEEVLEMLWKRIHEAYKEGILKAPEMTDVIRRMAMIPEDSILLPNPVGAACGILQEYGKTKIICLPGVPSELKAIFEESVVPLIEEKLKESPSVFFERNFFVENAVESEIAPFAEEVMKKYPEIWVKTHPSLERIEVHLTATGSDREKTIDSVRKVEEILRKSIKEIGGRIFETKED